MLESLQKVYYHNDDLICVSDTVYDVLHIFFAQQMTQQWMNIKELKYEPLHVHCIIFNFHFKGRVLLFKLHARQI